VGWYRVIKTVKGHQYAYLQRSFREGGRVRTESRYIGAMGDGSAAAPVITTDSVITTNPPRGRASGLRLRFDTMERHISPERLTQEYGRVRNWAQGLGVSPENFPAIAVRRGSTVRIRKAWIGAGRVLTISANTGSKTARKAYGKALGQSFLDGVRETNPLAFQVLANHLEPSFRATNRLLFASLAGGGEQCRLALSLQIHFFGRIHPVSKLPAGHIGLADYGERGNWRDEAADIIGEIATRGFRHTIVSRTAATAAALKKERQARKKWERATLFDRITGKRRALKRALIASTAARMATEEASRKLRIISNLIPELAR